MDFCELSFTFPTKRLILAAGSTYNFFLLAHSIPKCGKVPKVLCYGFKNKNAHGGEQREYREWNDTTPFLLPSLCQHPEGIWSGGVHPATLREGGWEGYPP